MTTTLSLTLAETNVLCLLSKSGAVMPSATLNGKTLLSLYNIVPLYYCYRCCVDIYLIIELELLLKG